MRGRGGRRPARLLLALVAFLRRGGAGRDDGLGVVVVVRQLCRGDRVPIYKNVRLSLGIRI